MIHIIAAVDKADGIGRDNQLLCHISADLKRFKQLTMGHAMIMGRKTFESFPNPLPGRRHIVLTRDRDWRAEGAEVVHSVDDALALAGEGEIAVVGGAEIYALFMAHATRIELTEVQANIEGDTHMPPPGPEWREIHREEHPAHDARPAFAFVTLKRGL